MGDWTHIRTVEANNNAYDRYWDVEHGAAVVYRKDRSIFGFANGKPFGPFPIPYNSNTQALRIRPEMGQWFCYAYCDTDDQHRAEYKQAVADI